MLFDREVFAIEIRGGYYKTYVCVMFLAIICIFSWFMASPIFSETSGFVSESIIVEKEHRSYLLFPTSYSRSARLDVLLFLHGLEENELSSETLKSFLKIHSILDTKKVLFIAPIGMKGAFPQHENSLAWWPKFFDQHLKFLKTLIQKLKEDYAIRYVFLAGFSNGSYFASQVLQSKHSSIFDGFLLQGGGTDFRIDTIKIRKPVVIKIGLKDHWHLSTVRNLKSHLLANGWKEKINLNYEELDTSHHILIEDIAKDLDFLVNKNLSL